MKAKPWVILPTALAVLCLATAPVSAQQPAGGVSRIGPGAAAQTPLSPSASREEYVLAPGDTITINVFELEEVSGRPYLIDNQGNIRIPLLGDVKAAGQTVAEFRKYLTQVLGKYVRQPEVTVTVSQFHTEPIFLLGDFKAPGIYTLEGKRTLVDILAISGGLGADASLQVKLTRRAEYGPIPLPGAVKSEDGKTQSVTISLVAVGETADPAQNIFVQPYDVITATPAEMVYVDGQIGHPSGMGLNQKPSISILHILALSGGVSPNAHAGRAWILRPIPNSKRSTRININLNRVVEGKDPDVDLYPNDFLYVPGRSAFAQNFIKGLQIGMPLTFGLIYLVLR